MLIRWLGRLLPKSRHTNEQVRSLVAEAAQLFSARESAAALMKIQEALALDPGHAPAMQLQGAIFCEQGDVQGGLAAFRDALQRDRSNASLHLDCGNACCLAGNKNDAEIEYRLAIEHAPGYAAAHAALGGLLVDAKRPAEARDVLTKALQLVPDDAQVQRRLALANYQLMNYVDACNLYEPLYDANALDIGERYAFGAAALNVPGRLERARMVLEKVIAESDAASPIRKLAVLSMANAQLLSGNWREGFRLYECRHEAIRVFDPKPADNIARLDRIAMILSAIPAWDGGDCRGKRLLVWVEQGLGDAIMFLRFISVLRNQRQAAEVVFLCEPALMAFGACYSGARFFVPGPDWRAGSDEFDGCCSLVSLPHLLDMTPEDVRELVPYLAAPLDKRAAWRDRIGSLPGLRVGLVWSGNPNNHVDALRSVAFEQLHPLLAVGGISFVSLQKDGTQVAAACCRDGGVTNWMQDVKDFGDTAALIEGLDLVIAVDTAVAHLAGALGKPVWLLNRFESEWRWMRDREDTPWYPTMRIFNQTEPRNWMPVIQRIAEELMALRQERIRGRGATSRISEC